MLTQALTAERWDTHVRTNSHDFELKLLISSQHVSWDYSIIQYMHIHKRIKNTSLSKHVPKQKSLYILDIGHRYIKMCVYMFIYIYKYVCVNVCKYVCLIFIYTYIYILDWGPHPKESKRLWLCLRGLSQKKHMLYISTQKHFAKSHWKVPIMKDPTKK